MSAMAIHDITDCINLSNGECLEYTIRKKRQIIEQFHERQKSIVSGFARDGFPTFKGHCGCILFDISDIKFTKNSTDVEKALLLYFGQMPGKGS